MGRTIGRNINRYDDPNITSGITLNSTTSTKILDANITRVGYRVSNTSSQDVWVKEQSASIDNDKKGDIVWKRSKSSSDPDNVYFGEVSAIAVSGNPVIYVVEV